MKRILVYYDLSERFGIKRVFMDLRHIAPSDEWRSAIACALQSCKIGVVGIGNRWLDELRLADEKDVPVGGEHESHRRHLQPE